MPYTANLLYKASSTDGNPDKPLRKLGAETDTAAIAEAERLLRSSRVIAGIEGGEAPDAGVIAKDGEEFVCCIVNQPAEEASAGMANDQQP